MYAMQRLSRGACSAVRVRSSATPSSWSTVNSRHIASTARLGKHLHEGLSCLCPLPESRRYPAEGLRFLPRLRYANAHQLGKSPSWVRSYSSRIDDLPQPIYEGRAPFDLKEFTPDRIRNFCIISHIDHGKTSLSTRLLEYTHTIKEKDDFETKAESVEHALYLDSVEVERERGITVKAKTVSMFYYHRNENTVGETGEQDGQWYLLNIIDTPGHADFGYEVSRSMAACEGAVLLVDSTQGIQAQTMANFLKAFEQDLNIVPVANKIDLPIAQVKETVEDMMTTFGVTDEQVLRVSAKQKIGIPQIFNSLIADIPSPVNRGSRDKPLRALLFDSWYDTHRGVVCIVRVVDGSMKKEDKLFSMENGKSYTILEVGILHPGMCEVAELSAGQVGFMCIGMKLAAEAKIGDTFCHDGQAEVVEALPGFQQQKPVVFAGLYPMEDGGMVHLQDAISKLMLMDNSVSAARTYSGALGAGFHCGFLGLLHMDVFTQRLEQDFDCEVLPTAPTVSFRVRLRGETEMITIENPAEFPDFQKVVESQEPFVSLNIITPESYMGTMMTLCQDRRGTQINLEYLDNERVSLTYRMPLLELITDFYDTVKKASSGYASFSYDDPVYEASDLVKIDILLNGSVVEPLASIQHRDRAVKFGRRMTEKLKSTLKRHMFSIPIQALINGKVVARETIPAFRKDVTAKLYGGDVTRKRKLLEKQKEGKKRMKEFGNVGLSQEDFFKILRT